MLDLDAAQEKIGKYTVILDSMTYKELENPEIIKRGQIQLTTEQKHKMVETKRKIIINTISTVKRTGKPEDVAELVAYLLSDVSEFMKFCQSGTGYNPWKILFLYL